MGKGAPTGLPETVADTEGRGAITGQNTILIADDAELNRAILRGMFEEEYNILEAENGDQALLLLRQYSETVTTVLLDLVMPVKNGYEVLEAMRAEGLLLHIPAIVITADDSADSKVRVFELGASDIIPKPFEPGVVKSRVKNIMELSRYRRHLEELVEEKSQRERDSNSAIIDLLSSVVEYRSLESGQHIRRIRLFAKILLENVAQSCREYGLTDRKIQMITDAACLHDVGKIAIPDSILNKPGKLTEEEFEIMKTHTLRGCEILAGLDRLQDKEYLEYAVHICRYHHERWDGRGYPDGLKGDNIPISAQVVAIADCYDALTTDRVYKKAVRHNEAVNMILNGACGSFSPQLLECFKRVGDRFERLAKQYADGLPVEPIAADRLRQEPRAPGHWDTTDAAQEECQLKYFAMLRYADATAMELDLNTGMCHLVYLADQDFAALRASGGFEGAIREFAQTCVHPDDRDAVLNLLDGYIEALFDEGLMRRTRRYRVLCRETGAYIWCRAVLIRMSAENPFQRKVLLLWRKEQENVAPARQESTQLQFITGQLLGGVQKSRNDKYFTLVQVNPGLVDMLGYSMQEIGARFQNRFIELVHPGDRAHLTAQFAGQLRSGKVAELEYRLVAKDGGAVWVSDHCLMAEENGEEFIYSILLDTTRSRIAQEQLRLSLERHQIILDQTNDIIFEWDIPLDELHLSSNWPQLFGYVPITQQVSREIPRASHIAPDDMPAFVGFMQAMRAGVAYKEIEFRIADARGEYRWRRARATALFDEDAKPFKAVGVLLDIDEEKRAAAALAAKAERDALTGLYNKAAGQERVVQRLSAARPDELSALMILDLDDFKQVNDCFGHLFGDKVLAECSAKVAGLFHSEDVIARIGGDEFLIFLSDIHRKQVAQQRADQILEVFQYALGEQLKDATLTCSIGVVYARGRTARFQTLFARADRMLYRAKAKGKNCVLFCGEADANE